MTPARLEEVESAITEQHRRFYGACRPESVGMAVELLGEVKRLREVLATIEWQGCDGDEECDCPVHMARAVFAGEEPTS